MRIMLAAAAVAIAGSAAAVPALGQVADRYGGVGYYPAPALPGAPVRSAPVRVLSWPGKSLPAAASYGNPGYPQPVQGYGPAPQAQYPAQPYPPMQAGRPQAYPQAPAGPQQAAYPSPYQAQPYYAPAPAAPPPAPGSTATAPSGVYPANTVPPQLAYPMAVPPQQAAPLVSNPQPPSSIYAPPPQAQAPQPPAPDQARTPGVSGQAQPAPGDPRQPQRMAMGGASGQSARYYSLHRQFGLQPDATPAPPPDTGQAVELVSSIDSGVGGEPSSEPRNRVIRANGKSGTALVRSPRDSDSDAN